MSRKVETVPVEYVGGGPMDGKTFDESADGLHLGVERRIHDKDRRYVYRLERLSPKAGSPMAWRYVRQETA